MFYVFPLYTSWRKVNNFAPSLVKDTWLLRISDVNSSSLGLFQKRHRVEVRKQTVPPRAWIFSPEIDTNLLNAQEAFESASDLLPLEDLVPSETLMEWVWYQITVPLFVRFLNRLPRYKKTAKGGQILDLLFLVYKMSVESTVDVQDCN